MGEHAAPPRRSLHLAPASPSPLGVQPAVPEEEGVETVNATKILRWFGRPSAVKPDDTARVEQGEPNIDSGLSALSARWTNSSFKHGHELLCSTSELGRDRLWAFLNSDALGFFLLAISTAVVFYRPTHWLSGLAATGAGTGTVIWGILVIILAIVHGCNSAAYHFTARRHLQAPVQQSFLRVILIWEATLVATGVTAIAAVATAAMRVDREDRDDDHTARIMRGFQYIMTPGAGLVVMPLVLLSLVSLWRKRIIPRVASEAYSVGWLRKAFVACFVGAAGSIIVLLVLGTAALSRYMEFGFSGQFGPRHAHETEAKLAALEMVVASIDSWQGVADFADEYAASGAPLRFASAEFQAPSGQQVLWESEDLAAGRVANVVAVSLPAGTFLFSADPILIAVAAWDPVFAALVAVAVVALFVSASVTADAMLVSPLEMTLSALVDAASVLDRSGRMRGAPAKERVDLIQAVRRILAHLSNSFGGVAADRRRSMPLRHSFSDRGSVPGSILSGNPLDTGAVVAASGRASSDAARLALSGGGDASDARNVISSARPAPRARAVSEDRAKPSMRFAPAVLNHLGTNRWNPWLSGPELVSACHIMFIKSRVPESICKKDSFVAFAERALDKHPDLRFHSKRRAVDNMHEVFAAMKRRDLSLSPTRTLAVLVASLCMDLCSVGREDEELCADGHPLALTYALDRPQKQAAVAEVLRIATEEGCNIFSAVGAAEARNLKEHIRHCILATSPAALRGLTSELVVLRSQAAVSAAEALAPTPKASRSTSLPRSPKEVRLSQVAPGLAMRVLTALAAVRHGWSGVEEWRREEERWVVQELQIGDKIAPGSDTKVVGRIKELREKRHKFWHNDVKPFMQALASVSQSMAPQSLALSDALTA